MKLTTVFFYLLALLAGISFYFAEPLAKEPLPPVPTYATCPETAASVLPTVPTAGCVPESTWSAVPYPEAFLLPDGVPTGEDSTLAAPDYELFPDQWQLENRGWMPGVPDGMLLPGADARIVAAWRRLENRGSSHIRIAIFDDGFDPHHPELAPRVVATYDAMNDREELLPRSKTGHGTSVAGVVTSAAPNAELVLIQGLSYEEDVQRRAVAFALKMDCDILICSWGTIKLVHKPNNEIISIYTEAMRTGRDGKGMIVVFAAGNEGLEYINYYAQIPGVLAVGASNSRDGHSTYSNRGPGLTLVAPSDGVWPILTLRARFEEGNLGVTLSKRFYADGIDRGVAYHHFGGTSSSTPLAGAVAALVLGANPDLTSEEVIELLVASCRRIGPEWSYSPSGFSHRFGYGCINADEAVALALARRGSLFTSLRTSALSPVDRRHRLVRPTYLVPAAAPSIESSSEQLGGIDPNDHDGFGVQVVACADFGNVQPEVARLKDTYGLPIIVKVLKLNGRPVYRILIGPVETREEAASLRDRLLQSGEKGAWVRELAAAK